MRIIKLGAILVICALVTAFFSEITYVPKQNDELPEDEYSEKPEKTDYSDFATQKVESDAAGANISAKSAILCTDNGLVIFEKQADTPLPMASITKVMSCIVALENISALDQTVQIPKAAVGIEGSSVYLSEGESVTLEMLIYSAMLESANDAVTALAILVKGSEAEFVNAMNEKAKELSMTNTNFLNPHGLHEDGHFTTARDYAKLMAYALKNDKFCEIISTKKKYYPSCDGQLTRVLVNHNRLLTSYGGMIGGKTGYTKTSGRTLVTAAERNGTVLICVTINASDDWQDHTYLFDVGFDTVETKIYEKGAVFTSYPIAGGEAESVALTLAEEVKITASKGFTVTTESKIPHFSYAPIKAEKSVGEAVFYVDGKEIKRCALKTQNAVDAAESEAQGLIEKIKDLINGRAKNT